MNSDIQFKIDEARYFLNKMKENFDLDPDRRYFLSGFLSSAKSIDSYIIERYNCIECFKSWRNKSKDKLSIDTHVLDLIKLRNKDIHKEPVNTETEASFRMSHGVTLVKPSEEYPFLSLIPQELMECIKLPDSSKPRILRWMFNEGFSYEIIPFCEQELVNIIEAAEEAYEKFEHRKC